MADAYTFLNAMHKQYGDIFEFYIGSRRLIMLNRVDLGENGVFKQSIKSNNYFLRDAALSQGWEELGWTNRGIIGNRLITDWLFNKRLLSHCLSSTKYLKESVSSIQQIFSEAEGYWKELGDSKPLEFTEWMHCFIVDTQIKLITGQMTYSLSSYYNSVLPPHLKKPLPRQSLEDYSKFMSYLLAWPPTGQFFYFVPPLLRHYVPGIRHIAEWLKMRLKWLESEVAKIVREKKKMIENMDNDEAQELNLLTMLLTINTERDTNKFKVENAERPFTEEEIVEILIEAFIAALDTTTSTLCFLFYNICKHPDVKSRLVAEIDATISSQDNNLDYDSVTTLFPYTNAVMKESARMITVVPLGAQVASKDDEFAGYKWSAGTAVAFNYGVIHRHKAYWKDPEIFRPERFLDEHRDELKPRAFMPFGGTVKSCPGKLLAERLVKTVVILLFSRFEVELCEPDKEVKRKYVLNNRCEELKVYLKARNRG
ncbi:6084_t:CDS:2 [Paraglomus occultum]|uniref:6084_t:CDS:1 n=1 Tax=Paraglomus occultum TaxID=144539 RepID=A0A9N9ANN2_9GLOM|nr:6084_t:CDS:2 [Paraglomus occultum]